MKRKTVHQILAALLIGSSLLQSAYAETQEEENCIVVESDTLPPEITIEAEAGFETWYSTGVELTLYVTDPIREETSETPTVPDEATPTPPAPVEPIVLQREITSGLESVTVLLNGETLFEDTDLKSTGQTGTGQTGTDRTGPDRTGTEQIVTAYEKTFTLSSEQTEGSSSLVVIARDRAGNEGRTEQILYLDGTAPIIIGTGLTESVSGEAYNGQLIILERNPDLDTLTVEIGHETMEGVHEEDRTGEAAVDAEAGTIHIPVVLEDQGTYSLEMGLADQAANYGELKENFVLDLEPPVVTGFEELNGQYFDAFHLPLTVEEMAEDLSEVTAEFWLDGIPFDVEDTVSEPGLHIMRGTFTDAFAHETTQVIRFVVRSQETLLHRAGQWVNFLYGQDTGEAFEETETDSTEERRRELEESAEEKSASIQEQVLLQGEKLQDMLQVYGRRIFRWGIGIFGVLAVLIVILSLYEKKQR